MEPFNTELTGAGGISLRGEGWLPVSQPRAVVVLAHGKDEHRGRYRHVARELVNQGYAVYAQDHRGHGTSDGTRGVIARFDDYVDDLDLFIEFARQRHPDLPLFLLGHSMGGLIATRYALQHQTKLKGLVLCSAALQIDATMPPWRVELAMAIARFFPNFTLPRAGLGILSRDPDVEQAFAADPLCNHAPTKLAFARALILASWETLPLTTELNLPLLVMHGTDDKLTSPSGSQRCIEQAASSDKTLKLWPGDRHELFNELDKADVIAFVIAWLNERTDGMSD